MSSGRGSRLQHTGLKNKYTWFGVAAIMLWACSVGLTRSVTELLSPIGGAAMMYSVSTLFLWLVFGFPRISLKSLRYFVIGGILFAAYEICISLAVGLSHSRHQAMEMAVVNYLWPALTVLLTVFVQRKRNSLWLYVGVLIAFSGVVWCLFNGEAWSLEVLSANVADNPLTYGLALLGAVIWALYCTLTQCWSDGENGITLFFALTALALWGQYGLSDEPALAFSYASIGYLLASAAVMGSGYGLWNLAILRGDMMLLATLSYFTPVFATLFSSLILGIVLGWSFWQGVAMVSLGSLICWWVTRDKPQSLATVST